MFLMEKGQIKSKLRSLRRKNWPRWLVVLTNILFWCFLSVCIISAAMSCIFIKTPVSGRSMQPTINAFYVDGDINCDTVLINRLNKGGRGDIVVLKKEENTPIVKRLIAIGGDMIGFEIDGNQINTMVIEKGKTEPTVVESRPYDEMIATYRMFYNLPQAENSFRRIGGVTYLLIDHDDVFYLGDNRPESRDCSEYGPMSKDLIVGKVVKVIGYNQNVFAESFKFYVWAFAHWFVGR